MSNTPGRSRRLATKSPRGSRTSASSPTARTAASRSSSPTNNSGSCASCTPSPRRASGSISAARSSSARRSGARARWPPASSAPKRPGPVSFAGWDAAGRAGGQAVGDAAHPDHRLQRGADRQHLAGVAADDRARPPTRLDPRLRPDPDQPAGRWADRAGDRQRAVAARAADQLRACRTRPTSWIAREQRAGGWPTTSAATWPAWAAGSWRRATPPTRSSSPSPSRTPNEPGVYIDDVDGGAGVIRNKQERRRVMRKVYGDALVETGRLGRSRPDRRRSRSPAWSTTRRRPNGSS